MNKRSNKTSVPTLRFPEFHNEIEWIEKSLGSLFTDRQDTGYLSLPLLSLTEKDGIILQEDSNRKNNSNSDKSKYLKVLPGDIAYNTMRMWEGRCARVGLEGVVSPAYTICKPNDVGIPRRVTMSFRGKRSMYLAGGRVQQMLF